MHSSEHPAIIGDPSSVAGTTTNPDIDPEDAVVEHIHLPPPTIWPVVTAFGVALGGFGLVTAWPWSIAGLLIMFSGIASWIQELRHEYN